MNFRDPGSAEFASPARATPDLSTPVTTPALPPIALFWTMVVRHKWVLIASVVVAMLIGVVLTLLAVPQYTAVSTLQIQREQRNFTNVQGAQAQESSAFDQEFYQTQYGLLKSESLASQVADQLHLQDNPQQLQALNPGLAKAWFDNGRLRPNAPSRAERLRAVSGLLLARVVIDPDRNSQLVHVSFTSPDPALSQQVANRWGTQFIQSSLDRRFETTSYARNFLENRLEQLRNRIDSAERSLVDYSSRENIITVPSAGGSGGTDGTATGGTHDTPLVATDLAAMNSELLKATAARITAKSRLASGAVTQEELNNGALATLRARRSDLAAEYAKLLRQFDPAFPAAVALRSQIAVLDRDINGEHGRVNNALQSDYNAAAAREAELQARVAELKKSYSDVQRRSIQYDIIQRDVDTNRQLYAALLQRFKEIGVAGNVGVNNVSIVDQAAMPRSPSSPRLMLNLAVALLVGLLAGSGIVIALEQLDSGIKSPADVQSALGVPVLGTVPKVTGDPLQELLDLKAAITEAYSSIQTTMELGTDHGFPRSLAVTSARPGEGKSTTSYALASRLARLGRSTILIDGDMRSPSLSRMLGVDYRVGLSNYLSGANDVDALMKPMGEEFAGQGTFAVIAAGLQPPSTTELLAGAQMSKLIAELLTRFDHVVIDSPPLLGLADAPLLANQVEGVVFVVEAQHTPKALARVAVGRLLSARATVIGALLTKFDRRSAGYGYGYGYGYEYSYGSKED